MAKKKVIELDPKLILQQEINTFIKSMKGKSRISRDEAKHMFSLFNSYYHKNETNYGCDLCAIRIYKQLEKISKEYEQQ
jgi:hypothetical protein